MDFLVKYTGDIVALHVLLEPHQFNTTKDTHTCIPPSQIHIRYCWRLFFSFLSSISVILFIKSTLPSFLLFVLMVLLFVVIDVPPFSWNYLPPSSSSPVSFAEFVSLRAQPIEIIEKLHLYPASRRSISESSSADQKSVTTVAGQDRCVVFACFCGRECECARSRVSRSQPCDDVLTKV